MNTPSMFIPVLLLGLAFNLSVGARICGAQEALPKEGNFVVTITQHGSWEGFPIGHQHWVWIARREGVYVGDGPLNEMTSRCISKGRTLFGVSDAEINCVNTDADGNTILEISTEQCACGPGQSGGTGSGEFIGGTGSFHGIRGQFEIERKVGARDREARTWTDHVKLKGVWQLP